MLPDLQIALVLLWYVTLIIMVVAALVWGGMPSEEALAQRSRLRWIFPFDSGLGPERLAALTACYMVAVQVGSTFVTMPVFDKVDIASLLVDIVGLACFVSLALSSRLLWTLWPASFQLLALLSHLPRAPMPEELFIGPAYALMKSGLTMFAMGAVVIGIALHQRKLLKTGPYSVWRDFEIWTEFSKPIPRQLHQPSSDALKGVAG